MNIINEIIYPNKFFPNNPNLPLLIYKNVLELNNESNDNIKKRLQKNGWIRSWVNGIYNYHHYHSNTHEALIIHEGSVSLQIGGEGGKINELSKGDVIIFPAGVAHKNIASSSNFECIGSYPLDVKYDMNYGKLEEYTQAVKNIELVQLPLSDPIFGKDGHLLNYWK